MGRNRGEYSRELWYTHSLETTVFPPERTFKRGQSDSSITESWRGDSRIHVLLWLVFKLSRRAMTLNLSQTLLDISQHWLGVLIPPPHYYKSLHCHIRNGRNSQRLCSRFSSWASPFLNHSFWIFERKLSCVLLDALIMALIGHPFHR